MFSEKKSIKLDESLKHVEASNQIQQIKSVGNQPRAGILSPNVIASTNARAISVPSHVQGVRVRVTRASDATSKVTVTFNRDPNDYFFSHALVHVSGYKGNPAPTQVASGQSPISFSLENTGDPVSVKVQANGNLGPAPLDTAPNATLKLRSTPLATVSTSGGTGPPQPPAPPPPGANIAVAPTTTYSNHGTGLNTDAVTYSQQFLASSIFQLPAQWTIGINVATGPISFQNFVVARTLSGSLTVVDYTPITFGGTQNPTFASGIHTSDVVALQIDTAHDYWFMAYSVHQSGALMYSVPSPGNNSFGGVISGGTGKTSPYFNDYTDGAVGSPNTIVPPATAFGLWLSPWVAA